MAFHWQGGWYFERITKRADGKDDGTVHIYHEYVTWDGEPKKDVAIEIDAASWCSIMQSVCYGGWTSWPFDEVTKFHMGKGKQATSI